MRTDLESIGQIHNVERDLQLMTRTPGKIACEYCVKALKLVLGQDLKRIGHFEISDKKSGLEVEQRQITLMGYDEKIR